MGVFATLTSPAQNLTECAADTTPAVQPAKVYFEKGKLNFRTDDGKFHIWMDNRIFIDAAYYSPTHDIDDVSAKANKDLETNDGHFRFSNGVAIRRARLAFKAELWWHWIAELDIDFAYNEVELKDMYLGYRFNPRWSIKAGNFKEPQSMERMTSSRYLPIFERPMPVEALSAGRRLGVAATGWGRRWWASAGVFGRSIDIIQKERNRGSDGWGFSGRAAVSPIDNGGYTLHLGAYGTWRRPDMSGTDKRTVEFRTFPGSRVDRRRFIRAELKDVRHYETIGLEAGVRAWDKALVYGEYIYTRVSRYGLKACDFQGWYVTGSWMLLGSQRRYSPEDAEFGGVKVHRRGGNLELAGRVAYLNLNDFHDPANAVLGGSGYTYTVGLNWYPVSNILIGASYSYVNNDKYADDKGGLTVKGKPLSEARPGGIDFSAWQMRLMVSF